MYFTDFICSQLEVKCQQNLLIFYQSSFNVLFSVQCCIQIIWCLYLENRSIPNLKISLIWMGPQLLQGTLIIIRGPCNSWGPIDIREIFGNFLKFWEIFKIRPIILYFLIYHCTNYIHAKFYVPRTIFYHFIKKSVKS